MMSEQKWIFCCGAKRSGSTLQFNLVASIIEKFNLGIRVEHSSPKDFIQLKEKYKDFKGYLVFKTHDLTDEINDEIINNDAMAFYCYRDIRDVIVSFINKKWITHSTEAIESAVRKYLDDYFKWENLRQILISRKYESFNNDIAGEIKFIATKLGINVTDEDIKYLSEVNSADNLKSISKTDSKVGLVEFDSQTRLHKDHLFDGRHGQYLSVISKNEIYQIERIASAWLFRNGYSLNWTETDLFISYSQHMDDYLAWVILSKKKNGIIFEVGAFDGIHLSNSISLAMKGWKCICIEPNPEYYQYLKTNRPNEICLNYAVVGDENTKSIDFFSEEIGVLSGCNVDEEDIKRRYKNRGLPQPELKKINVQSKTLNSIIKEVNESIKFDVIDILSIDVEGFEMEVLKGVDFNRNKVNLVVIEANNNDAKREIINYFSKNTKMCFLMMNKQNLFFVSEEYFRVVKFDLSKCIQAHQFHPKGEKFVIQSVPPTVKWETVKSGFLSKVWSKFNLK